ncbi:MAG TPA: ankyrin repeat domain-containing protein [Phycisphaerae bacterium]|nr:ankyrin repeat domain-containing protein [Phycisphaerae bacterium]
MAMDLIAWNRRRLFNAISVGDIERVREALEKGVDPNVCDKRGRPAIISAVRARIPESGVVDALLEAGADAEACDANGLTALDYARRRLVALGPGPDRASKSRSLDAHGNLVLSDEEKEFLEEMRREHPDGADEFEEVYIQERRKAALRQFMPRRELRIIIDRLESTPG